MLIKDNSLQLHFHTHIIGFVYDQMTRCFDSIQSTRTSKNKGNRQQYETLPSISAKCRNI